MALGHSDLCSVRQCVYEIEYCIRYGTITKSTLYTSSSNNNYLFDCWNTFDFVSKQLNEWADGTLIGSETKEKLIKLSNILKELIDQTVLFENKMKSFCDRQDKINGKRSYIEFL